MNVCTFFYCCGIIILLSGCGISGFPREAELYEGSECTTEHSSAGLCKRLPECPSRLADALAGRRGGNAVGRCGFENHIEIVCCPLNVDDKIGVRPAEIACQEYENEVTPVDATDDGLITPNIFDGSRAAPGEFPYMAALGYENSDGEEPYPIVYDCGGSLISSKYVLTAAHCVSNVNNRVPKVVRIGSEDTRAMGGQEIPVESAIAHPRYRKSVNYNDIALVSMKSHAKMSPNVKPICLQTRALRSSNVDSNTSFVVIGFGATAFDQIRSNKLMKTPELNLIPTTVCNNSYASFSKLPVGLDDTMICAVDTNSTRRSDACQGDSGGPLLMISGGSPIVMAVTSFGQSCGTEIPGVYTSVHPYLDWIESKVWPERTKV